jgi:hypothetical protein
MPSTKCSIAAALALVSLGAACTSSEPISTATPTAVSIGAGAAPAFMPFAPETPAPVDPMPTPAPASAPTSATSAEDVASAASACAAAMAPPPFGPSPFQPDLGTTVTQATTPPRPISGGTLLVLHDGSAAVASDPDRDQVFVVDLATRALRATVALMAGDEPGRLVEDGQGLVHVALRAGGAVATIDPATGTVTARTPVCAAPRGLAYQASEDAVHVACADGKLVTLSASGAFVRAVTIARDLRDVVALADGRLLVSTFRRAQAFVVDADGAVGAPLAPPARRRTSMLGEPQTLSPAVAWRLAPLAGTGALMLHQRGVDDPVSPTPGGYAGGKGCDGIVESAVSVVAPGSTTAVSPGLMMVTLAVDVAVSPDGRQVAIAAPGNAHTPLPQVTVAPLATLTQTGGDCFAPASVTAAGDAAAQPPGQVVAVAFTADGTVVTQSREPAALWLADGRGAISLPSAPTGDTGHEMFHVNAGGGIACASCHPEGGDDGRVWNFACLGPRRTQSVRGGLSGTEPFHWDGDMPDFSTLVTAVFVGRMSGPTPTGAQSAALLHWLDGVPELPTPVPADPAAVARGQALFTSAAVGCTACHAGPHLTNNASVDVGTGDAGQKFQVPSLRGVGWRAPYLHTGCAATLADRFGACGGGDKHGKTSQLRPLDVSDLTAYLDTL